MRKVLSFILVLILVLSVSACSAGQDSSSGGQSSAGSASLDTSEYSSWTKDDWESATEKQQEAGVEKIFIELGEYAMEGYAEEYEKAKEDPEKSETLKEAVDNMQDTVLQYFGENPDSTIGKMIKDSKKAIDSEDLLGEETEK